MINTSRRLKHAVRFSLAASALAAGAPIAFAQTAPPAPSSPGVAEEVVVTGSRIQQAPNDVSISPVTSVTSLDIQQTGLVRTEDLLNNLPQVVAEQGSGLALSSNGTATVSLRGLGGNRTLVLVNNRRLNPGGGIGVGFSSVPDINQIPADLIERADVLTGGASAVYGADAVAGVVNFILNTHYDGVKLDANYGFYNHKNDNAQDLQYLADFGAPKPPSTVNTGQTRDVSFVAGSNFADGKGNATVYATYLNSAPAVGYQFDHAGCTLITPSVLTPGAKASCGGSATSGHGDILLTGLVNGHGTTIISDAVDPVTGQLRPFNGSDLYNYGALSFFQRQAERFTAGAFLNYDVNDKTNVYSEFMYARNSSKAQYGPSGDFFLTSVISCANPLLTAQEVGVLCNPTTQAENQALNGNPPGTFNAYIGRRNVEGGGRQDNYTSNSFREVLGVKGRINDVWNYDVYGQIGITTFQDIEGNYVGQQQLLNALDVVTGPNGQPACRSAVNGTDPGCVPWNIWVPGGVTQAALNYLSVASTYATKASEYIASGSVTGDLGKYGLKFPAAASGLIVNVGAEYRQETYLFEPDYIFANGFASGGNGAQHAIDGEFHVTEGFTEIRLPIIDDKPGFYQLSTEAGYRYSTYTSGFNTNTYKFGVEWAPVQDLRFRASYNRAIRAPNIGDLFAPAVVGASGTADPCWGAAPKLTQAQCALTGVTAAEYGHVGVNPAAQINSQTGGNPSLTPEAADTYSFGFVFQPQGIPNWITSIDYYDIKINQTITSLPTNTIINGCATGVVSLCGLIHRGPTGSLWLNLANYVQATQVNIGTTSTKGVDLKSHYRLDVGGMGKVSFDIVGSYTANFLTQPLPTGGSFDCAGYWGSTCNSPDPKWRHVFTTTWGTPWAGLDLTLRWRYLGATSVDSSSSNPQLAGSYFPGTAHIPAYNYLDVSASIPITSGISFRLGINNLTDKDPPTILNGQFSDCPNTTCNDNTWAGTFDALGRFIYAHVSAKF